MRRAVLITILTVAPLAAQTQEPSPVPRFDVDALQRPFGLPPLLAAVMGREGLVEAPPQRQGRARRGSLAQAPRRPSVATTEEEGRWRPALIASAALAVTGAAVAHWSTDRADAAYDRYLSSAGATRQQNSLDRAERYDRIAGAAFLAMEAGIALSAYFVFF